MQHYVVHTVHVQTQVSSTLYIHQRVAQNVTVHLVHQQVRHAVSTQVYMRQRQIPHSLM